MLFVLAGGLVSDRASDGITIVALVVTIVGFAFAIIQINRVGTTAKAAADASRQTRSAVADAIQLTDLSSGVRRISEIKVLIRTRQFYAASLRMSDLRELIVKVRRLRAHDLQTDHTFQEAVALVASFQDSLNREHYSATERVDPLTMHRRPQDIADFLNGLAADRLSSGG